MLAMRFYLVVILLSAFSFCSYAMQDSVSTAPRDTTARRYRPQQQQYDLLDSVAAADVARQQHISDSLAMVFIQKPDPLRKNQFVEEMMRTQLYKGYGFLDIKSRSGKSLGMGMAREVKDNWIIAVILGLLLYTAFLRITLRKDISNILQSFYNKQTNSPVDADSSFISFRAFLGLLVLFGLTFGLFLYQLSGWYQVYYSLGGGALFMALTGVVISLLGVKVLLLKFLGFVFDINQVINRYISILCFTYFSIAFVFLPVTICLTLVTAQLVPIVLLMATISAGAILVWQYLRNSIIVISNFRFSKFYLFVYLCALEICPILILIKALNI